MSTMMNQNFESPFLELPREIRDMIYDYALDWPNLEAIFSRVSTLRNRANERWRTNKLDKTEYGGRIGQYMRKITKLIQPTLITPSVLLLNRQISDEARIRLYRKTLVLPGQVSIEQHYDKLKGPAILHFMSKAALQNVQRVELRINFKPGPIGMLEASTMHSMLSPIWVERNSVQELRVVVNEPSDQGTCSRVYQYNVTAEGLTAVQQFAAELPQMFEYKWSHIFSRSRSGMNWDELRRPGKRARTNGESLKIEHAFHSIYLPSEGSS